MTEIPLNQDFDQPIRLDKFIKLLQKLQEEHGKKAFLKFDAGYNSVSGSILKPDQKD
jgi:hypothetical protein